MPTMSRRPIDRRATFVVPAGSGSVANRQRFRSDRITDLMRIPYGSLALSRKLRRYERSWVRREVQSRKLEDTRARKEQTDKAESLE